MLYAAPKQSDKLRKVVDNQPFNKVWKIINAPIVKFEEMFDGGGGSKVLPKIDLNTVFHEISIKANDVKTTACNTKYRQFEYLITPMEGCNAPAIF